MSVLGLSSYGHLVQQPKESNSLSLYQLGRYDSKVATCYQAASGSGALRFVTGSESSSAAVDHGVAVFTVGTTDLHVIDASSSELLWSVALPEEIQSEEAIKGIEVVICSPHFIVLWSSSKESGRGQCWTAMSPKTSAKIAKGQDSESEAEDEEDASPIKPVGASSTGGATEVTSVQATETMAACVSVPLPITGKAASVEAIIPVEEEEGRISFVVVTAEANHHAFTQANLAEAAVAFIQSGTVSVAGGGSFSASLSRRSSFYVQVAPEEFSASSAVYVSRSSTASWVLTAKMVAGGESITVNVVPVSGNLESNGAAIRWGTAINAQCWVLVGEVDAAKATAGASAAPKKKGKASSVAASITGPWIASLAVDGENGSAVATAFPMVDSIAACAFDEMCEGVRLVRFSSEDSTAIEATVVPFPDREAIVLDTVELLLQGVGLEENTWELIQSTAAAGSSATNSMRATSGYSAKDELLFHYLIPTTKTTGLSVLAVSAPQPQHTRRGTNGKAQLIHLVAAEDMSNSVFQFTWHPNAVRYALRSAGSGRCLTLLRVVTEGLRANGDSNANALALSPLQLRTVGMSLAMHVVTLTRPLGLAIPAADVETLYVVNSQTRSLGPNLVAAASRLDALTAFAAEQEAKEASVFGNVYSVPASLKMKKYAYGNNAAAVIAALKSRLPAELQETPEVLTTASTSAGVAEVNKSSPFAQYEAGAVVAGGK